MSHFFLTLQMQLMYQCICMNVAIHSHLSPQALLLAKCVIMSLDIGAAFSTLSPLYNIVIQPQLT